MLARRPGYVTLDSGTRDVDQTPGCCRPDAGDMSCFSGQWSPLFVVGKMAGWQRQTAVTAHFSSEQLPLFVFAQQIDGGHGDDAEVDA